MKNKKLWFKAKMYGWGWHPISWQGWIIILLYTVAIIQPSLEIDKVSNSVSDFLLNFSVPFVINTIFLLIICYAKGEKPEWRWGER